MSLFEQARMANAGRYYRVAREFAASAANYNKLQARYPSGAKAQLMGLCLVNSSAAALEFSLVGSGGAISANDAFVSALSDAGVASVGQGWYLQDAVNIFTQPYDGSFHFGVPVGGTVIVDLSPFGLIATGGAAYSWIVQTRTVNAASKISMILREFP